MVRPVTSSWGTKELHFSVAWEGNLKETIKEVEKQLIKIALKELKTKTRAAEVLGVNRMTILRKLKK